MTETASNTRTVDAPAGDGVEGWRRGLRLMHALAGAACIIGFLAAVLRGGTVMPAWTHCSIGVHVNGTSSWWTAVFLRNPSP